MYSRIYGTLGPSAAEAKDPDLAAHLSACLSDFAQAQISTFDSFAARIARTGAPRFGMVPDFVIDDELAVEKADELALEFLLEHRENDAVRELVSVMGFENVRRNVLAELAVEHMSISSPPSFAAFHKAQGPALDRMEEQARNTLLSYRSEILAYQGVKTTDTSKRWLDAMSVEPGEDEASFSAFVSGFAGLVKPSSKSKDDLSQYLSQNVDDIRKVIERYRLITSMKAAHPARRELYDLFDEFRVRWDRRRRIEGVLSFNDIAHLAIDTLETDAELLDYYRNLYRYAMIDEFQDDNELQKRLLFLIAGAEDGGLDDDRLFFVGDEKQSIYLFRGADVSVFRSLAEELGTEALPLSRNFRSEPGVIDMINKIFSRIMEPEDPDRGHEKFEARFESLLPGGSTAGVEPRFIYLELPYRPERKVQAGLRDAAECEAWELARIIHDAVESGCIKVADRSSGLARPARYEDFAVLLRSTGNQVHFEKYLRLFGVPYGSENACGLFSEAVACDIYYALRLALYPEDRNALAAYLRSPFAGLSDEAIVRILLAMDESDLKPFSEDAASRIPERDRSAHRRGAATMARLAERAGFETIAATLRFLWFEAGYRAALLRDPIASAFEEHFELLHSLAVEADNRSASLAAFVAKLEGLVGRPDKQEIDLPRDGSSGVTIMTVHKSKGLEFPIVIVPQANNVGPGSAAGGYWFWDDASGPTFKPPADIGERTRDVFFEQSRERREAMENAELKRLLYVALTRAESHIIVTAVEPSREDAKARSFRTLLDCGLGLFKPPSPLAAENESRIDDSGTIIELPPFGRLTALDSGAMVGLIPERSDLEYYRLVAGAKGAAQTLDAQKLESLLRGVQYVERRAVPAFIPVTTASESTSAIQRQAPTDSYNIVTSIPNIEQLSIDKELEPPASLEPRLWGTVVHEILEARLSPVGGAAVKSPRASTLTALIESLGESAADSAVARAGRLAEVFLQSDLGRRALAARERFVELELALALRPTPRSPRYLRGVIDLAFMEGGRVVIVDYKTEPYIHAQDHTFQLSAYAHAASALFKLPAEAYIFYLYGGGRSVHVGDDEVRRCSFPTIPYLK
jgi:ATP-dependent helicase/nuclease subunit A